MALLEIDDLVTVFDGPRGSVAAVDGVSLRVDAGETVCLVGESGCGKTLTALSILRLLPSGARIAGGVVRFDGRDLASLSEGELRRVRGARIAMIFQEPMASLNPVFPIGDQIGESLRVHRGLDRRQARRRATELLELVEIPEPEARLDAYPHQLSGGMRQRVMIASALACEPHLLIADEPTTALDVTIQAQILDLLGQLQRRFGMAILLVTHDLGIVAERAERAAVMYAGRIVEEADASILFTQPRHPYTQGLLRALPSGATKRRGRLETIGGIVPEPWNRPSGCRFRDRCPSADAECATHEPGLEARTPSHRVACWHV